MFIKLLAVIAAIIMISMSVFVILYVNSEENKNNSGSDLEKFFGKWMLINNQADKVENEITDTTEEPDNFVNYETYEFLSNGTYYYLVDKYNSSGIWEINNSILVLTSNDLSDVLPLYYEYVFNDNNRVSLTIVDEPDSILEFEKVK